MTELYRNINPALFTKWDALRKKGCKEFAFQGGRRSGKTFFICQANINNALTGDIVNMASMTGEQGRLGVYADCKTILGGSPSLDRYTTILSSPREIRFNTREGKLFFNSYQDPERAKGIACDYLFVNEANNFTLQQYTDLAASVRKGIFIDYNPNTHFWVDDTFDPDQIIKSTWQDNRANLTPLQIKYFEDLKARAFSSNATQMDEYLYRVYYLGEYSEIGGDIFNGGNIHTIAQDQLPTDLCKFRVYADPSALMAADYFACVFVCYSPSMDACIVLDTYSINAGTDDMIADKIFEWAGSRDDVKVFVETNGLVGINFYNFLRDKRGYKPNEMYNTVHKFNRICANYHNITDRTFFVETDHLDDYLAQVYTFGKKCEHDDNIDAVSSGVDLILKY